ncbi:MAG: hypothetical protein JXA90_14560 [Planctomycetes bacterium]|nr:hypothetical protein [Planctomycetota bacterium]
MRRTRVAMLLAVLGALAPLSVSIGQSVRVLKHPHDPYGFPRPGAGHTAVPLGTSFYVELGIEGEGAAGDAVDPGSVRVSIRPEGGDERVLLDAGRRFAEGATGRIFPRVNQHGGRSLAVFIDPGSQLEPLARHTVEVAARSEKGAVILPRERRWSFTTEPAADVHEVDFDLDVARPAARWKGGFFTGFCKASFCTSRGNRIPSYELMEKVQREFPRAWSLQRDFWMTGMEHRPRFLSGNLPNIVRERETRRVAEIRDGDGGGMALRLEDFFGHEQYGIPSGRPPSEDYRAGDEVLIADGIHGARAEVIDVDDAARTVRVGSVKTPEGGWRVEYDGPLPRSEDPSAPGLFPPGGCYLRKLDPPGTPHYFWGRLDQEFDLAHRRFGRRLVPNFADAPGDLSIDGMNWTRPKDYAQYHDAVRAITAHIIERYGTPCLDFYWSVFNEPDLGALFWRSDWKELQRFYDYTVDAVLRAFEDGGYDSDRVVVGGLELAAIFGTNLRLREFLEHCSPRAESRDAVRLNAACADRRLDGRRSKRVEKLCGDHGGKGSPCDFISIHSYNRSDMMAAKLIRAKEIALEVDAEYYADLRINSHESCPDWSPPPDPAAHDSYLGNGYFPTWCADVARRLIARASGDARYGFGESILTFWGWPNTNFEGANAATRVIHVDDDGDGREDRTTVVAMPILHFLALLSAMGEAYWTLGEKSIGGHTVSGFASRAGERLIVLVYSHHPLDTESRSGQSFDVGVSIAGLSSRPLQVTEHAFDAGRNSYFRLGRRLRESTAEGAAPSGSEEQEMAEAASLIAKDDRASRLEALRRLRKMGARAKSAASLLYPLTQTEGDEELKREAVAALLSLHAPAVYPASTVREIEDLSELRTTRRFERADAALRLSVRLRANAACFFFVEPREQ